MNGNRTIGMVLFPGLTQLDLTGPYEVFSRLPDTTILLLAASREPVRSEKGMLLVPDLAFNEAPPLDVLFVPGGPGIGGAMEDEVFMAFLRRQGAQATHVTSVCTGALLLAAAGLLDGYRATTHWLSLGLLRKFDVQVAEERVVVDRNRITGGGVTAGIDFGLVLAAQWHGEETAKKIQLMMEYDPAPPFHSGSPREADLVLLKSTRDDWEEVQAARTRLIDRIITQRKTSS
jgi:cyclohexyl-isocyanide hydratase